MKTKIALISTGVVLSAVATVHITHHCPLQQLHSAVAKTAPAPAANDAKANTVVLK